MMVDTELVEVVRSGYLEHEGGGRWRLRVTRDPGMLQTLRHTWPVVWISTQTIFDKLLGLVRDTLEELGREVQRS